MISLQSSGPSNKTLITAKYHIVITLKKSWLLSFFRLRVIINGKDIYTLVKGEKLVIPLTENNPKIVLTDGYHITKPLELVFHHIHTYYFRVVCVIDNYQLVAGIAATIIIYLLGLLTGFLAIKLVSFFPIFYFLFFYYIRRKDFLQIHAA